MSDENCESSSQLAARICGTLGRSPDSYGHFPATDILRVRVVAESSLSIMIANIKHSTDMNMNINTTILLNCTCNIQTSEYE